jgi:hypothetical protein
MCLLFVACQADVTGVEELLRSREDIDSIDLEGCTALHIMAYEGQGEVMCMCLGSNDASPVRQWPRLLTGIAVAPVHGGGISPVPLVWWRWRGSPVRQ